MAQELPPQVPEDLETLNSVIMLLGQRAKGHELKSAARQRLQQTIGAYPPPPAAGKWKAALKGLAKELRELG